VHSRLRHDTDRGQLVRPADSGAANPSEIRNPDPALHAGSLHVPVGGGGSGFRKPRVTAATVRGRRRWLGK